MQILSSQFEHLNSFIQSKERSCNLCSLTVFIRLSNLSATLAKTFRRRRVFSYFLLMKRVQGTCFKNSLVVLQFSFFASPQAKNHFWPDHLCEQRSKVSISKILSSAQRLQQCSSRNSILLQVTRCIQVVHRQNMETSAEIFFIPA